MNIDVPFDGIPRLPSPTTPLSLIPPMFVPSLSVITASDVRGTTDVMRNRQFDLFSFFCCLETAAAQAAAVGVSGLPSTDLSATGATITPVNKAIIYSRVVVNTVNRCGSGEVLRRSFEAVDGLLQDPNVFITSQRFPFKDDIFILWSILCLIRIAPFSV